MHYNDREMPKIDLDMLAMNDREAYRFAKAITKKDNSIRASKPPVDREKPETGERAYVWRMLVFFASPRSRHQCWPITAEFDLVGRGQERRDRATELEAIVSTILDAIPTHQHYGVRRGGEAFGMIGTPRLAPDGSIVYRDSWGD